MDSLVNRAYNYAKLHVVNSDYQKGFSDGSFHGYQDGAIDQTDIIISNTIKWINENLKDFLYTNTDGRVGFEKWEDDYKRDIKNF
ncbi:MAG: hypothetical protein [Wendovervirus sonii]|uniref:Uncharacterized protein n=1 Tax=phage Lak_Megaphage_Sonny TaxID=3109229 RepID=A0ABZ0Z2B2_9CAUD|nr:MAG: hypothetical protein [phage Lak_Megaphage_Sonny]